MSRRPGQDAERNRHAEGQGLCCTTVAYAWLHASCESSPAGGRRHRCREGWIKQLWQPFSNAREAGIRPTVAELPTRQLDPYRRRSKRRQSLRTAATEAQPPSDTRADTRCAAGGMGRIEPAEGEGRYWRRWAPAAVYWPPLAVVCWQQHERHPAEHLVRSVSSLALPSLPPSLPTRQQQSPRRRIGRARVLGSLWRTGGNADSAPAAGILERRERSRKRTGGRARRHITNALRRPIRDWWRLNSHWKPSPPRCAVALTRAQPHISPVHVGILNAGGFRACAACSSMAHVPRRLTHVHMILPPTPCPLPVFLLCHSHCSPGLLFLSRAVRG